MTDNLEQTPLGGLDDGSPDHPTSPVRPPTNSNNASPQDLAIATTNMRCSGNIGDWQINLASLMDCDVVVVAEPGDFTWLRDHPALSSFNTAYCARLNTTPATRHRGGVAIISRREVGQLEPLDIPLPPGARIEAVAARLSRPSRRDVIILAVYATCDEATADGARRAINAVRAAYTHLVNTAVEATVIVAGDLNARHTLFGDTVTNPRGRALADWVQLDTLAMASAPSSIESDAFIDHIIYPASLTATEAVARTMHGTDHRAVFAVIDPDPRRSTPAFFRESIRLPLRMDRGHFLNVLDTALARISLDGTPCGIEGGIVRALIEALTAAGATWERGPVYEYKRAASADEIVATAQRSPWGALRLLRPMSNSVPATHSADALLATFGSQGKQPSHGEPAPPTVAPDHYKPVSDWEVLSAVESLNRRAAPDSHGISAPILEIACDSDRFLTTFAALMNTCLKKGKVPGSWRECTVRPLPKPGKSPDDANNLRPIYLCTALAKLGDLIMDVRARFEYRPHPLQLGFRKGMPIDVVPYAVLAICAKAQRRYGKRTKSSQQSTTPSSQEHATSLPSDVHTPSRTNSQNSCASQGTKAKATYALLIAVDLSDAFPSVPRSAILDGYRRGGLASADTIAFKTAMLSDRRMRVSHRGRLSQWDTITDGTNQGYVSGPTDFSAATWTLLPELDTWMKQPGATTRLAAMAHRCDQRRTRQHSPRSGRLPADRHLVVRKAQDANLPQNEGVAHGPV